VTGSPSKNVRLEWDGDGDGRCSEDGKVNWRLGFATSMLWVNLE